MDSSLTNESGQAAKKGKVASIWQRIFPGFTGTADPRGITSIPGSGVYESFAGDVLSGLNGGGISGNSVTGYGGTDNEGLANGPGTGIIPAMTAGDSDGYPIRSLPPARHAKYSLFDIMASDPTIDSALKMHIANALSAKPDTGEIISIESIGDETNPMVEELRSLHDIINSNCQHWAYQAAKYGVWYARVYGEQGKGVTHIRSDYYTHPRYTGEYEQGGQLAGFVSTYQQTSKSGGAVELMEPWKFLAFKLPIWQSPKVEPIRADATLFDIANDDLMSDTLTESQNYGQSLIETAFSPWIDLLEAICSVNASRKNASRMERMVGVNTGKLSPQKAAQYLNVVAGQLQKINKTMQEQSLRKGFVQTIINHMIPIFGDGRGRLDVSTLEGTPNIDGLVDVDFHVKRLGAALGIDPALLGFGEMLAGGLGDGGFFRVSVLAAVKAQLLRTAIRNGVERLCDIHLAYKFGKAFLPGERPYRIVFHSISSALDREEQDNHESRVASATSIAQLIQLIDPEFTSIDKNAVENFLFTDVLKIDEEKFKLMFPKEKGVAADKIAVDAAKAASGEVQPGGPTPVEQAASGGTEDDQLNESAAQQQIDALIRAYVDDVYAGRS